MGDNDAECSGTFDLGGRGVGEVLDAVAGVVAGNLAHGALEGVEALLHGPVAETVDGDLEAVRRRVEDKVVDLFLVVVGRADGLFGPIRVADD